MMQNMMNRTPGVPLAPYTALSEVVLRFADAVESLITGELRQPFSLILSEAVRDRAADGEYLGTRTKTALTNLAMNQGSAAVAQCDLLRGMAAALPADKVFFSPYPLARTCVVTAAKAWFIVSGPTRVERLRRYLNEELDALYGAAWDFDDPAVQADIVAWTDDHLAVGANAGLHPVPTKKRARGSQAPYLVRSDRQDGGKRPSNPPSCGRCSRRPVLERIRRTSRTGCSPPRRTGASPSPVSPSRSSPAAPSSACRCGPSTPQPRRRPR